MLKRLILASLILVLTALTVIPNILWAQEQEEDWWRKFKIGFSLTTVIQGTNGINTAMNPGERDTSDASTSFDIEVESELDPGLSGHLHFEGGDGTGLEDEITTLSGLNADANGDPRSALTEALLEWNAVNEKLKITFGKYDITAFMDENEFANDETSQFLSFGFRSNIAVDWPADNTCAVVTEWKTTDMIALKLGLSDADVDFEDVYEGAFGFIQANIKPNLAGKDGNYRLYGWFNALDHTKLTDALKTKEHGTGFGFNFDQRATERLGVFGRLGLQDDSLYQIKMFWSLGAQVDFNMIDREAVLGVAYGKASIGSDFKVTSAVDDADESHWEAYLRWQVADKLVISPDYQFVTNANGDDDAKNFSVFGLRIQVDF